MKTKNAAPAAGKKAWRELLKRDLNEQRIISFVYSCFFVLFVILL